MLADRALLTLSIDLELDLDQLRLGLEGPLELIATRLVELLTKLRMSATWSVADPAISAATAIIRSSATEQELAVLGDRSWVGTGCERGRFSRELLRRVQGARQLGIDVSTLALRNTEIGGNLDLLVQAGVQMLRRGRVTPALMPLQKPELLYPGVLATSVMGKLPSFSRWDWSHGLWHGQRILQAAVRTAGQVHLRIDAAEMVERAERRLRGVSRFLAYCAELRDRGDVEIITLRALSGRFLPQASTVRTHSILRPAA